ncbi:hypothetical protein [Vallicoccus soli]|uniref:hypothetical protein n=1 Tax=Vallicoccus soli TaxID=2339232 RepID=UPI001C49B3B9|nr:hypothetical protein [Vallicoccus soli]
MHDTRRLVTSIDLDEAAEAALDQHREVSISALLELELVSGRRLTLLDDRGWSSGGPDSIWSHLSLQQLEETARAVVGPDEPPEGRSYEEEAALHWAHLSKIAHRQGVPVQAGELAALPHDVHISPRIRARLTL